MDIPLKEKKFSIVEKRNYFCHFKTCQQILSKRLSESFENSKNFKLSISMDWKKSFQHFDFIIQPTKANFFFTCFIQYST